MMLPLILFCTDAAGAASTCPLPAETQAPCTANEVALHAELARIGSEYRAANPRTVARLVAWDQRLRNLTKQLECGKLEYKALDPFTDASIGVDVEHYGGKLEYTGKLLVEAHTLDSHSHYRSSTLFATIESGVGKQFKLEDPDPLNARSAKAYLHEFPHGPFAREAALYLADLYKDIFMALRDGPKEADYHYDCVQPYFHGSASRQMLNAQHEALRYYRLAYSIRAATGDQKYDLCQMADGTINSWSYCPD